MDFSISKRAQDLKERARDFVRREVMPLEPRLSGSWSALEPSLNEVRGKAKAAGLWAPDLEVPLEEYAVLSEELGRSPLGHYCTNAQAPDVGNMSCSSWPGPTRKRRGGCGRCGPARSGAASP